MEELAQRLREREREMFKMTLSCCFVDCVSVKLAVFCRPCIRAKQVAQIDKVVQVKAPCAPCASQVLL